MVNFILGINIYSIFIYVSTLIFVWLGFIVSWTGRYSGLIRFDMIIMAILGIILSLMRLGFMFHNSQFLKPIAF